MLKNRIFYIIVVILCAVFAIAYAGRFSMILLLTIMILPIISFSLLLITHLMTQVKVGITEIKAEKEEEFILPITITNNSLICSAPVFLYCDLYDNGGAVPVTRAIATTVYPFKKRVLNLKVKFAFRGQFPLRVATLVSYDFLKLFTLKRRYRAPQCYAVVIPRTINLDILEKKSGVQTSDNTQKIGSDVLSSLRPYRPSEPLKYVHWKMSAKHDELIVKEFSTAPSSEILVILCLNKLYKNDVMNFKSVDTVIETGLALALQQLKNDNVEVSVHVNYVENDTLKSPVLKDISDYNTLFSNLSVVPLIDNNMLPLHFDNSYAGMANIYFLIPFIDNKLLATIYSTALGQGNNFYILAVAATEDLTVPDGKNVMIIGTNINEK